MVTSSMAEECDVGRMRGAVKERDIVRNNTSLRPYPVASGEMVAMIDSILDTDLYKLTSKILQGPRHLLKAC